MRQLTCKVIYCFQIMLKRSTFNGVIPGFMVTIA